jgi:hemolysin D
MAVTVKIKTGSRTVISYLLSPLTRYKPGNLRERVSANVTLITDFK